MALVDPIGLSLSHPADKFPGCDPAAKVDEPPRHGQVTVMKHDPAHGGFGPGSCHGIAGFRRMDEIQIDLAAVPIRHHSLPLAVEGSRYRHPPCEHHQERSAGFRVFDVSPRGIEIGFLGPKAVLA